MSIEADPESIPWRVAWACWLWILSGFVTMAVSLFGMLVSPAIPCAGIPISIFCFVLVPLVKLGERDDLFWAASCSYVAAFLVVLPGLFGLTEVSGLIKPPSLTWNEYLTVSMICGSPASLLILAGWLAFTGNAEYKIWRHTCRRNRLNRQNPPPTSAPNPARANARGQFPVDPSDGRPAT